ncbi:MAG: hypothetical protein U9R79_10230, partial [Armatimonadota bacterium]|nr:hypothetical protein [Armatimonadota bacterium]
MRIVSAASIATIICLSAAARPLRLQTADGLALEIDDGGRVTSISADGQALPAGLPGGFSICDYANQPEPRNLIPNPGFEQEPEGWSLVSTAAIDEQVAHSGQRSVRLHIPPGEPGKSNLGITVDVKPNTRYRCELWIRRERVGVTGTYVSERDDEGNLTGTRTQYGRAVPDSDGVWHQQVWDLTTQPQTTRLNIRGDIYNSTGTIWLDDFAIYELGEGQYRDIEATVTGEGDEVTITGGLPDANLELEATARSLEAGCIRIEGLVRDSTGEDRAIGVRFSLPVDAEGWTWYTDAEEREEVTAGGLYRRTYDCRAGVGLCSVYPWAAISGPEAGLTMALPLSQGPRCFILQHDQRQPALQATFYFSLSADSGNHPSQAPFSLVVYRHDPRWGMRSAMERYYTLFPESFVKRPTAERYLNYANLERFDPNTHDLRIRDVALSDAGDFGEGYRFIDHVHGCYDFRMVPYDHPERPSDEVVMGLLREMVEDEREKPRGYVPTSETIKKLVYGPEGQIRYIGDTRYWRPHEGYNHNDWPGWGLNFHVNEDPGVSDYLAEETRRQFEEYAAEGQHLPFEATVTADAIEGYHALQRYPNFRREHFATTLLPLTFGKDSLKPCIPNAIWDFHHKAWWPLTEQYQVAVYGNSNGYEQFFTTPYVDVPMIENDWDLDHPGRFERYLRAIAHHKIWRFWRVCAGGRNAGEDDPELVRLHFARGLAYAVYPAVYPLGERAGRDYRHLYRQHVPAIEELSIAGWEPVPHARATGGVVVERYGFFADGDLHLTLRNYGEETTATVTIDREALDIPADAELVAVELTGGNAEAMPVDPDGWEVRVAGDGAAAYWIGTREQLSDRGFRLAMRTMGKIRRLFASELSENDAETIDRIEQLAEVGQEASDERALAAAEELMGLLDMLEASIETQAPVDLAKLILRARGELGCIAAGEMGAFVAASHYVEAPRGGMIEVGLSLHGFTPQQVTGTRVLSPWSELSASARVDLDAEQPMVRIDLPADAERELLPFVLEVRGERDGAAFVATAPFDVRLARPLEVSVAADRLFRGEARTVTLTIEGEWMSQVTLTFEPPAGVGVEPEELQLTVTSEPAQRQVTFTLDQSVHLGGLRVPWTSTGENPAYNLQGELQLGVSEPV